MYYVSLNLTDIIMLYDDIALVTIKLRPLIKSILCDN